MLSERYRPTKIAAIIGNEQQRLEIAEWLKRWKLGDKPLLLTGPPGVGKSSSILAAAKEYGYTVVEFNASDVRTRENLREKIGPAVENASLFGEEKLLIFFDEIDGISGRGDYAGMDFVLDFIENSTRPVAMAANIEDLQKLRKITQKSLVLRFKPVSQELMNIYLKSIASREKIETSENVLKDIAKNSRGDVRQALNSLQTVSGMVIAGSLVDQQFSSDADAIDRILASETLEEGVSKLRDFGGSPIEKIRAIFDAVVSAKNISIESKSKSLDLIAKADIILARINREQSWRLLRYLDRELALASCKQGIKRADSSIPWNLRLSIWNDGKVIKAMQSDLAIRYHVGKSDFSSFFLPYFAYYFKGRLKEFAQFLKEAEYGDSEKRVVLKLALKS